MENRQTDNDKSTIKKHQLSYKIQINEHVMNFQGRPTIVYSSLHARSSVPFRFIFTMKTIREITVTIRLMPHIHSKYSPKADFY